MRKTRFSNFINEFKTFINDYGSAAGQGYAGVTSDIGDVFQTVHNPKIKTKNSVEKAGSYLSKLGQDSEKYWKDRISSEGKDSNSIEAVRRGAKIQAYAAPFSKVASGVSAAKGAIGALASGWAIDSSLDNQRSAASVNRINNKSTLPFDRNRALSAYKDYIPDTRTGPQVKKEKAVGVLGNILDSGHALFTNNMDRYGIAGLLGDGLQAVGGSNIQKETARLLKKPKLSNGKLSNFSEIVLGAGAKILPLPGQNADKAISFLGEATADPITQKLKKTKRISTDEAQQAYYNIKTRGGSSW